jgi:TatD DNase family protein
MLPQYIDIHAHTQFEDFALDAEEVRQRALENSNWLINVGTDLETSHLAVEVANKYQEGVYAIIGLHPNHSDKEFDFEAYKKLASSEKVLGIGECGLDYYRNSLDTKAQQEKKFIAQIKLANEIKKPLMLHIRNKPGKAAYFDALEILKKYAEVKGDVHFFAGNWEEAQAFLDFGFTLSFTGVITFTHDYDEVIKKVPLDMIMTETDCPYLTPVPYRGKRNEPFYVREVVKKIAEIKNLPESEVARQIIKNAQRVFGI